MTQEKDKYKEKFEQSELERKKLEKKSEEDRKKFEKKIDLLTSKYNTLAKELSEERELNKCLQVDYFDCVFYCVCLNFLLPQPKNKIRLHFPVLLSLRVCYFKIYDMCDTYDKAASSEKDMSQSVCSYVANFKQT